MGAGYGGHVRSENLQYRRRWSRVMRYHPGVSYAFEMCVNAAGEMQLGGGACETILRLFYKLTSLPENRKSCLKG